MNREGFYDDLIKSINNRGVDVHLEATDTWIASRIVNYIETGIQDGPENSRPSLQVGEEVWLYGHKFVVANFRNTLDAPPSAGLLSSAALLQRQDVERPGYLGLSRRAR